MKWLLPVLAVFICASASGQIFKRVGPDGTVYFSDEPEPGARQIDVAPPQTITLPPAGQRGEAAAEHDEAGPVYTAFAILSPGNEEGVRANDGNVTVQLSLQPELKPGHKLVLTVDGEDGVMTEPVSGMSVALANLSRGRHTVGAMVVDASDKPLIQTDSVSFYVLRAAVGGQ